MRRGHQFDFADVHRGEPRSTSAHAASAHAGQFIASAVELTLPGLLLMAALVLYAFRISLGGQPIFGAASLED